MPPSRCSSGQAGQDLAVGDLGAGEVLRLVEYIDQDVAAWLGQTSRFPELLRTRP
ncbi:hypothetical protein ACJ6WF_48235 [Streptomyces sp. MMS24-I2-30]|uniref:hypothetical protein n=1 Tax=Streptomyces sp. MMS24-I2-30 TaxID=3351564 RepID=UPI003896B471